MTRVLKKKSKDVQSRKALGRGLSALLGDVETKSADVKAFKMLAIEKIRPNPNQPRKIFESTALEELAASIREHGVLQPILVRRLDDSFEIVAGERRWRAAGHAGLHDIPAIVKDYQETELLEVALLENLQREDLDPLEEANTFHRLLNEHGLKQEQLAQRLGKSRAAIANSLRLLKLPESVLGLLSAGKITAGHARALMTVTSENKLLKLAREIVKQKLSVRQTEIRARQMNKAANAIPKAEKGNVSSVEERDLQTRLQSYWGTKVQLVQRQGRGRIEIYFHTTDHLEDLLTKLM